MEEKEIAKINEETMKLLDEFSKALNKVKTDEESNVEREEDSRIEGEGVECDPVFREKMFENAKAKTESFILAEKKSW